MEPETVSLGWPIVVLTFIGLAAMIGIGWYSYRKNVGTDLDDFFSASKSLGFVIIALSIFADSYSGNSFLGYAAATYRSGAWFLVYPQFMVAGVIGALIIAPPLINLGREWDYTSPVDYLEHRFNNKVAFLALLFMIWGTFVQFTEQFFAMGHLGKVASGGMVPYEAVIILFGTVLLIYVGLGGFRGTALAAAVQGTLMLLSLFLMLVLIGYLGGFSAQMETVWQTAPSKLTLPSDSTMVSWYSIVLLVLLGLPTYLHIQQFYLGVDDAKDLRTTFKLQAPIFFFAALTLWVIGMFGAGVFPELTELQADKLVPYLMGSFTITQGGTILPSLISLGIIMATLSTAGAAVMVLSMAVAKDTYKRFINPDAPDQKVIRVSRVFLAVFLTLAIVIAFTPDLTIWGWTQLKFEFLLQATPVFVFGLYSAKVKSNPAIAGMLVGALVAVGLYFTGHAEPFGIHAGIIGLVANSIVFLGGSYISGEDDETERAREILHYNSIEYPDDGKGVKYILPAQNKSFWIGLAIVLALMVPWYAPESWNARGPMNLPIWTWVIIGSLALESLFVVYGASIWQKKPITDESESISAPDAIETDD